MENRKKSEGLAGMKELAVYREGARELSDAGYNRAIGLLLMYGFGINALITYFTRIPIMEMLYSNSKASGKFMVFFLIGYLILCIGGSSVMRRAETNGMCFLGYNMIVVPVGVLISIATCQYDPQLVTRAMLLTCIVSAGMLILGSVRPDFFLRMGPALLCGLFISLLVQSVSSFLFHYSSTMLDWVVVVIMSLYIGFDWARAGQLQHTTRNAIIVSASLYLDIVNIFLRLLRILSRAKRK